MGTREQMETLEQWRDFINKCFEVSDCMNKKPVLEPGKQLVSVSAETCICRSENHQIGKDFGYLDLKEESFRSFFKIVS